MLVKRRIRKNISGEVFGRLIVKEELEKRDRHGHIICECICVCGNLINIEKSAIKSGHTKSCGCLRKDFRSLPKGEAAFNELYSSYKSDAKRRGRNYEFNLTKENFREIVISNCFYCRDVPKQIMKSRNSDFVYNGIDRVNNDLGYTENNVVPCCFSCNRAKSNMSKFAFLEMVEKIYRNLLKDK